MAVVLDFLRLHKSIRSSSSPFLMKTTMLIYQLYLLYAKNLNENIYLFLATENTDLEYVSIFPTSAVIRKKNN